MTVDLNRKDKGKFTVNIYDINSYPFPKFKTIKQNGRTKKTHKKILDCILCLDIETSTYSDREAFMYVWQISINQDVVIGRTYDELLFFLTKFKETYLTEDTKAIIYVHNLSYEFQFLKKLFPLKNIFLTDVRDVLTWRIFEGEIEFRCSYRLTNMSLSEWAKRDKNIPLKKLDYNYTEIRTPSTHLKQKELKYIVSDVLIMYYGIKNRLAEYDDNLHTIPLTSTGYVRRLFRQNCKNNQDWQRFYNTQKIKAREFIIYNRAFQGGQVRLNPAYNSEILKKVKSYDKTSDYPYQLLVREFPSSPPITIEDVSLDRYLFILKKKYLHIIDIEMKNVKLKPLHYAYIQRCSCVLSVNDKLDNGRIITADRIRLTITSIDFEMIRLFYNAEVVKIHTLTYHPHSDLLPECFRKVVIDLYKKKTKLKGIQEEEAEYMRSKNLLNSAYGMTVTNPIRDESKLDDDLVPFKDVLVVNEKNIENVEKELEKFYKNKNNFLPYTIGVWVTAYARQELANAIYNTGIDFVYCDTDSVKFLDSHEDYFEEKNKIIEKIVNDLYGEDASPEDIKGKKHTLGLWEYEGSMTFKGFGSKKYVTIKNKKDEITIAGCTKKAVRYYHAKKQRITSMEIGDTIPPEYSGRTAAYYNDEKSEIYINGEKIISPSCIVISNVSYRLGITDESKLHAFEISQLYHKYIKERKENE